MHTEPLLNVLSTSNFFYRLSGFKTESRIFDFSGYGFSLEGEGSALKTIEQLSVCPGFMSTVRIRSASVPPMCGVSSQYDCQFTVFQEGLEALRLA